MHAAMLLASLRHGMTIVTSSGSARCAMVRVNVTKSTMHDAPAAMQVLMGDG